MTDRSRLHIAIQKSGRLSDQSRDLLKGAGLRVQGANDVRVFALPRGRLLEALGKYGRAPTRQ